MKRHHADYQVIPFRKYQQWMAAAYHSVQHKPMIHGLIEVDVTRARAALREHQAKTGESLSFTAYLIGCLAKAVDEHKAVQAYRRGAKQLVLFKDVDVYTLIEHDAGGQKYPVPHVIRAANRRTLCELHREIRAAQAAGADPILKRSLPMRLPTVLTRPFLWAFVALARRRPRLWKSISGTVGITAVGMFGEGAGWGIPIPTPTALMLTVGGIGEKQAVVDGQITIRDSLSLTISVDHEIVDGAPAARFARRLKELIESGYGLDVLADSALEPAGIRADGGTVRSQQKAAASRR